VRKGILQKLELILNEKKLRWFSFILWTNNGGLLKLHNRERTGLTP